MNQLYHKIETLFKRDMDGNKKLIEGDFRNESVEYLKDNQWIFTEKVDGTNVRVHWDGHKVSFGGRTDNSQMPMPLIERLQELFGGSENEEIFEEKFGEEPVTFYGEGYGGKIQSGCAYSPTQEFIMFDVMINDNFLERENVVDIAKGFNLETVPIILEGTIQDAVGFIKDSPLSKMAVEEKEMEGVVGKPLVEMRDRRGNRLIVKVKVKDFI